MKLILLRGYPGTGKTTLGRRLAREGYGTFIDHNELIGHLLSVMGKGVVYDDEMTDQMVDLERWMVGKLLRMGKSVIVARGFTLAGTVEDYLDEARRAHAEYRVLHLQAPEELLEERIQQPKLADEYGPISVSTQLKEWINHHPSESLKSAETVIDASKLFDEVLRQAIAAIEEK